MRRILFRAWKDSTKEMLDWYQLNALTGERFRDVLNRVYLLDLMQYVGIEDKKGVMVFEKDILRFTNKREWYRNDVFSKRLSGESEEDISKWLDLQPFEERVVSIPEDYEWLLSSEIQSHWEIVGNTYENKDLLEDK